MLPHSRDTRFVSGGLVLSHGLPLPWLLGIFLFITWFQASWLWSSWCCFPCVSCAWFLLTCLELCVYGNLEKFWPRIFKKLRIFFKCFISPAPLLHSSWTSIICVLGHWKLSHSSQMLFLLSFKLFFLYFILAIFYCYISIFTIFSICDLNFAVNRSWYI